MNTISSAPAPGLSTPVLTPPIRIRHLYLSAGHNYVGHHGRPPGAHPVFEVAEVECVAGRGIRGDRYFANEAGHNKQITFFAGEVFAELREQLGLTGASPAATRRNVITEGVDLNRLVGREFEIQGVRFEGIEECRPCYWMNHAFHHEGVEAFLKGRGGLRARILSGGPLRIDRRAK